MQKKLLTLIKQGDHSITDEVANSVRQLSEILEAEHLSDIDHILEWLESKRKSHSVKVEEVGINTLEGWKTDTKTGNVLHDSGKFFSIIGIKVEGAKNREVVSWNQPIIKQCECGILGILRKKIDGIMHYLMWAKFEPGSIVNPQLSPTLQATDSNLKLAHGGKKPLFAEYFENGGKGKTIVSVVNVEDPSRFYLKTNRCMIVEIQEDEKINTPEDFIWLTLPQIKKLLKIDNAINALAREVFGSM